MANAPNYRRIVSDLSAVALAFGIVVSLSAGCGADEECTAGGAACLKGPSIFDPAGGDGGAGANGTVAPACTVGGKPHPGLGGVDVAATLDVPAFVDRARVKPYSALVSEYTRVLGTKNASPLLSSVGPTFGAPPDRWYIEPLASGVLVNTAYNVAFEGCLRLTGDVAGGAPDTRFATAPTADSAKAVCGEWIRKFWSREAAPDQVDACAKVAVESTTETYGGGAITEQSRPTTPKRQWAYACASVLSATGFLMY